MLLYDGFATCQVSGICGCHLARCLSLSTVYILNAHIVNALMVLYFDIGLKMQSHCFVMYTDKITQENAIICFPPSLIKL